jgi:maleate isomerase
MKMHKHAPDGVAFVTSRMKFPGKVTPETVEKLADEALRATELLIPAKVNVVAFCCTSGSFIKGARWDKKIIENIQRNYGTNCHYNFHCYYFCTKKVKDKEGRRWHSIRGEH